MHGVAGALSSVQKYYLTNGASLNEVGKELSPRQ